MKYDVIFELHRRLALISESNEDVLALFEQGIEHREEKTVGNFSFPVLPSDLNGLVLLLHINQHLRSGIGLRHIIDWMMYLNESGELQLLTPLLEKTNMERLAKVVTVMCQRYLGLRVIVQDTGEYPCEEFLEFILSKGNFGRKSEKNGKVESVFLDVSNPIRFFQRLQRGGVIRWEYAEKYFFLKPLAWIYQLAHIMNYMVVNKLSLRKILELHRNGIQQRELILKLGLEIDREI